MTAAEFQKSLAARITEDEAEGLRREEGLFISDFNRAVCLRLLDADQADVGPISSEKAARLEAELREYLDKYMPDRPEGHKWIILACLYLTFAAHLPMHPQAAAKWIERDGRYFCPSMEPDGLICGYCMCESMADAPREDA